ncbi:hypothetical protein PLICRDRAFT_129977 [Plicaturopsis crispa FD-325 SS-3]|nr:hypothetical protein PLICRDRAFT_129977 [Plicaturopsis crispa FD-325 SS-3]
MKSLRKSINNGDKVGRQHISTPLLLPNVSKPNSSILPPQKVIRAQAAYRPQAPQELPFQKGDFFYVIREVDANGAWYEAHNPVSGARGLVPRSMFEEFAKSPAPSRVSQAGMKSPVRAISTSGPASPKTQAFYAVVLHDFAAERADELDAKAGDSISVVAQSNREWFVAKPIGRLGRPGLIPVSFVEIRDPATNQPMPNIESLMDRGDLPKVEEWKRAMFSYKQNSIALGVLEETSNRDSVTNSPFAPQHQPPPHSADPGIYVQAPSPQTRGPSPAAPAPRPSSPTFLPEGILLSADVVSFHYEMDEFWFRIDAIFQPYTKSGRGPLPQAKQLVLFRVYNDFYDFQVALLNSFPREAGREAPNPRILPYMPGPADVVTQEITAARRAELDDYLHKLCDLNKSGGRYILEHRVIRDFLAPKPGDVEHDVEPRTDEVEALSHYDSSNRDRSDDYNYHVDAIGEGEEYESEVRDTLGHMRISDRDEEHSDGSDYEDEGYAPSPQREMSNHPYAQQYVEGRLQPGGDQSIRQQAISQNHQRTGSTPSFRGPSQYPSSSHSHSRSQSRSNSPLPERTTSPGYFNARAAPAKSPLEDARHSGYSRSSNSPRWPENSASSPGSMRSSQAPSIAPSGRSRSGSTATSNLNNPPISASNTNTAFIKIKIFDQITDDLIAIRVHPMVTHAELIEKVQARLGGDVVHLRYRDSITNGWVEVDRDDELREWLDTAEKHVLYAE